MTTELLDISEQDLNVFLDLYYQARDQRNELRDQFEAVNNAPAAWKTQKEIDKFDIILSEIETFMKQYDIPNRYEIFSEYANKKF